MRYFIELSYLGTDFIGWQRQRAGRSVQQTLEEALSTITRQPIDLVGSSRTDAGVHAARQYAHFDAAEALTQPERLAYKLNSLLPADLAVHRIFQVPDDFHARFAATYRRYEYHLVGQKNPFLAKTAWVFGHRLDCEAMNAAAALLLLHTDFESFSKVHTDVKTFICQIDQAEWCVTPAGLVFVVQASRFLRGMVRALVGTLLLVGEGKLSINDFEKIILAKDRRAAGPQAPARGLCLTDVGFDWSAADH